MIPELGKLYSFYEWEFLLDNAGSFVCSFSPVTAIFSGEISVSGYILKWPGLCKVTGTRQEWKSWAGLCGPLLTCAAPQGGLGPVISYCSTLRRYGEQCLLYVIHWTGRTLGSLWLLILSVNPFLLNLLEGMGILAPPSPVWFLFLIQPPIQ